MKKLLIYALIIIIFIILVLPVITGNLEKEELNAKTRKHLSGRFVKLSDGFTHYELEGDKKAKTILLVHGNAAPYFSWDYNFDELVNAGFRVLRYDIYGHGFSDRPDLKEYNRDLYDRQIVELLDRLKIKGPIYLVGTSQGGSISAYFAAKHPSRVEKIAFLSPFIDTFEGENMVSILKKKFIGEYMMNLVGDKVVTDPSKVLYSNAKKEELIKKLKKQAQFEGKKRAVLANMRGNALDNALTYYQQIKQQKIPVLLTWGEDDKSISYKSIEKLCQLMPEIEYYQIENAGHLAHYEFPQKINPILIKFLKNEK